MNQEIILLPAALMVLLTFIAWVRMFALRTKSMNEAKVDIKKVRSQKLKELLPEHTNISSEHFVNLFEMPVLFYLLTCLLYITNTNTPVLIYGSFSFVALRYLHTFIHLSYNDVMHRFLTYLLSSIILWLMWGYFSLQLLLAVY